MDQLTFFTDLSTIGFLLIGSIVLVSLLCLKVLFFGAQSHQLGPSSDDQDAKVIISGPMGQGKTHLWSRLVYGTDRIETVTSMIENKMTLKFQRGVIDEEKVQDSTVCLIDTPGHPRLRCRSLARNLPGAKAIIFVIDSQQGLTGKGLRETSSALELLLSFLQILHYQHPNSPLPKLSIHLSNSAQKTTSIPSSKEKSEIVRKTRDVLTRELNRRKMLSSGSSSSGTGSHRINRLESLDAIPSSELHSFLDIIKRLFKFNRSPKLIDEPKPGSVQLPEEQGEVERLLEEEKDNAVDDQPGVSYLDRYQQNSGDSLHWTVSELEDEHDVNVIKNWIAQL